MAPMTMPPDSQQSSYGMALQELLQMVSQLLQMETQEPPEGQGEGGCPDCGDMGQPGGCPTCGNDGTGMGRDMGAPPEQMPLSGPPSEAGMPGATPNSPTYANALMGILQGGQHQLPPQGKAPMALGGARKPPFGR